jgi:hypothetical protein
MSITDMGLRPREHSGIRVEKAVNGFIVHTTADTNYQRGLSLVAQNRQELSEVIRQVQDQQRRAMLDFFLPPTEDDDAAQVRHERFMRVAEAT